MDLITKIVLMPIIGFVIGYSTNNVLLKTLFHPKCKIFGFQRVLPKRRKEISRKIADIIPGILPKKFINIAKIPLVGDKIINSFKLAIENRLNNISIDELEKIFLKVAKKELSFITWAGGILGFIIGCIGSLFLLI